MALQRGGPTRPLRGDDGGVSHAARLAKTNFSNLPTVCGTVTWRSHPCGRRPDSVYLQTSLNLNFSRLVGFSELGPLVREHHWPFFYGPKRFLSGGLRFTRYLCGLLAVPFSTSSSRPCSVSWLRRREIEAARLATLASGYFFKMRSLRSV